MSTAASSPQDYYVSPGLMTDPGEFAPCFDNLPTTIPELVKTVQGLMLHIFWAERCGYKFPDDRQSEVSLRTVPQKMKRLLELDNASLSTPRPLERKLVGNCRDFTVTLCAMLKHQGIPARARCGFGAYFIPNHYEDHWVAEYWNASEGRWILVDAQLDAFQQETLGTTFDTLDVPRDQFITGGKAWLMARNGEADPHSFGIFDMHGLAFIRGNLVRDFLALNKIEILPWDDWGLIVHSDEQAGTDEIKLLDSMARLTLRGDEAFPQVRAIYENDTRLHPQPDWAP